MITIEARLNGSRDLSKSAAMAVAILWTSRKFSTADIAELLTVPECEVAKVTAKVQALTHITGPRP